MKTMRTGILGRKIGMSRVFQDNGSVIPVTLLKVDNCKVIGHKNKDKHGYSALQVGFDTSNDKHVNKPQKVFYSNNSITPPKKVVEFRVSEEDVLDVNFELKPSHFSEGQFVDVSSISSGKGFAGSMKRHNFGGLRASHGVSISHRSHGSTGQNQDPGRVFKGKKMAGHMGNKLVTTQNLKVVKVIDEENLILLSGSVSGSKGTIVKIVDSVKKSK